MLGAEALPSAAARWQGESPRETVVTLEKAQPLGIATGSWKDAIWPGIERCYRQAVGATPSTSGTLDVTLAFDESGEVTQVDAKGDELPEPLMRCVNNRLRGHPIPRFERPRSGKEVGFALRFATKDTAVGRVPPSGFDRDYVVTRLHARYSKDTLGEDLVFRKAEPILGGREVRRDGKLEHGATVDPSGRNNFQGRYIIRHLWDGPVDCDVPLYGRWGGPPGRGRPELTPARDLAFASRGELKLDQVARTDVPELGIVAPPRPLRRGEGQRDREERRTSSFLDDFEREHWSFVGLLLGLLATAGAAFGARRLQREEGGGS
jgi:hypothetical protein